MQANIAPQLIKAGVPVLVTQQTSLAEIAETIRLLGCIVRRDKQAERLVMTFESSIAKRKSTGKPRVYFEEWPEPMISGIGWVGELIERAGGEDIFRDRRGCRHAADRVV